MRALRKKTQKDWIVFFVLFLFIVSGSVYYIYFFTPKNSLELYQKLHFSDSFEQAQKLILDGYEDYFSEEDFNYIQKHSADSLGQFTLFEYKKKTYIIMTSPGTERLKVLAVEALPEDMREFFTDLAR
ncbi:MULTISPECIES: hypothetical protein [Sporosarcina]|uniref:Uncharacterized protein n=1 Tax=Sporosarcina newyorkensis TaxID=759851 RepID=A0A1T4YMM3_9BACL|nr:MULTISPECIES: hypothetical protein [Sporosarcina]SKB02511.1 hypothetical protein SAMN04244570_2979 [Sporosarcina newyorkensis]